MIFQIQDTKIVRLFHCLFIQTQYLLIKYGKNTMIKQFYQFDAKKQYQNQSIVKNA